MPTRKVVFRPLAEDDLTDLYHYTAERSGNSDTALKYVRRLRAYCDTLFAFPKRGRQRDDLRQGVRVVGCERRAVIAYRILIRMSISWTCSSGLIPIWPSRSICSRLASGSSTSLPLRYAPILIASVQNAVNCPQLRNLRQEKEHERLRSDIGIYRRAGGISQRDKA
ncbi:MAG: type II toxin-antitoxin system RelE/ParE family toxin [Deltaproteobacteria bacterium]|nr:type II toxin-antitoxin system RelE/ParE family toxin [Deltaproteobacteria bacterium]